ncbi:aldo/keto reductase [Cryobacterium breve]|uniref:aldo/keto reductase n=1 Tax=Cryobacterium breve TaxID=1259258 RepID=UPI00248C59E7|nr:aldo/keto reductase [Cryobacterium breve]
MVLASKAGVPHPDAGDHSPLSAIGLRRSVEGSLRRLGTDHIDLFYLHQPDRRAPLQETLTAIVDLVREGSIGALGVSNYSAWQISELNHVADTVGAPRPVVAQQLFNMVARRVEDEYLEFARTTGILTMVYNPLAGGLLTGRHTFTAAPLAGRFGTSKLATMYQKRYWDPRLFAAVESLATVADSAGLSLVELSLRWLLSHVDVGAILLGASHVEQLRANIEAASHGPLSAELVDACDNACSSLRGPMPAYCR